MKVPIFTGVLGSTDIARGSTDIACKNWKHFAIGAAISGISLVCGENVCGIDPELELDSNGKIKKSPEMDRRVAEYRRYHESYGDILIQMNSDYLVWFDDSVVSHVGMNRQFCIKFKQIKIWL